MCGMVSLVFLTGYLSMWTPTNLNNQTPKGVLTVLGLVMWPGSRWVGEYLLQLLTKLFFTSILKKRASFLYPFFKKKNGRVGEMSQQLGIFVTVSMDHGLVPNTHIGWLTAVYNSSSGKSNALFKPPWAPKRYHSWFQIFVWVKYVNCFCSGASVWGRAINELICQTGTCTLMGNGTGWEKWILMEGSRKWLYNRSPGHSSR